MIYFFINNAKNKIKFYVLGVKSCPPSVKNWIWNIRGMRRLWNSLNSSGSKFLPTRNFNQDPLENLFSIIRAQGVRNNQPTCSAFRDSFKTVILNNFMSSHSPNSNCEEDQSAGALQNLKEFVLQDVNHEDCSEPDTIYSGDIVNPAEFSFSRPTLSTINLHAYIAGAASKKFMLFSSKCTTCKKQLLADDKDRLDNSEKFELIQAKKYCPKALLTPNSVFVNVFCQIVDVLSFFLPRLCLESGLSSLLTDKINYLVGNEHFTCRKHGDMLFKKITKFCIKLFIKRWTKEVNCMLNGSSYSGSDFVKKMAVIYYNKHRAKKNAINKTKKLK